MHLAGGSSCGPRGIWGARGSHEGNGTFLVHYTEQGFGKEQVLWTGDSNGCGSATKKARGQDVGKLKIQIAMRCVVGWLHSAKKPKLAVGFPGFKTPVIAPALPII